MLQTLIDFIMSALTAFFFALLNFFTSLVNLLQDLICWILDELFAVVVWLITLLPSPDTSGDTFFSRFSDLPAEILNVVFYLHIPQCVSIILAALGIRLLLQLIPFTRLGS